MAIRRHVRLPTPAPLALGTAHLLLLPVHRELLEGIGSRDLLLPALARTRRAAQGDALLIAAVDEQLRTAIGRINEVLTRRQLLVYEGLLDRGRALCLMDTGRGCVDVREEVGGGGLTRFADMHHVAGPGRVAFVAVARLGIVGGFDAFSGRRQLSVRFEPYAALGASPCRQRLVHRPIV